MQAQFYSNDESVCHEVFIRENVPLALQSPGHPSVVRSAEISPSYCLDLVSSVTILETSPDQSYDDYLADSYENYDSHFQEKEEDPLAKLKRKLFMTKSHFRST